MKLSKLLAASLTLMSIVACASGAEARNPFKGSPDCPVTLNVVQVFPGECGTSSQTFAQFLTVGQGNNLGGSGNPLLAQVAEATTLTNGYAGALIFDPTANLVLTDLSTYTPIETQVSGNTDLYSQTATLFPLSPNYSGDAVLEQAVAYSYQNKVNGKVLYGISFIPASEINGSAQFSNHALKNKSQTINLTTNINLFNLNSKGELVNLIGNDPKPGAVSFNLLGLASALTNGGADGTVVQSQFDNFAINNTLLPKALCPSANINCAPFIPVNSQAASAAARAR